MVIEADISHIKQIAEIEKENFQKPWSYNLIYGEYKNQHSRIYVFLNKNQVAGYIIYRCIFDEVELLDISVKKDFRRCGIADNLIDFLIEQSKNCNIFLEVRQDNDSAINLYEKKGFRKIGLRKDYYSRGIDGFVMKLYVQGVQDVKNESGCCARAAGNQ
ncbi:MAG: ribosomal-protein-alanine N-acetyltransferase [Flexistipes sinusarabici]|uniref:Ribosomal-protein-alanine N-acetyltransferase n=1 Tax=Flexistipes sinusarabici TaxID=2352 RepID=A0A5D0MP31_FLESI|nr:ribosomal protein S18-alanine N-acetyltransferase [Flexistipes sinusarabici]TYB33745.1 MAG: ribosomal-protein-alanine N-acetyltransferase [Flexistipes sinusarabici]